MLFGMLGEGQVTVEQPETCKALGVLSSAPLPAGDNVLTGARAAELYCSVKGAV